MQHSRHKKSATKAFTLIEVLIALVIIAIAFLAIEKAMSTNVATESTLEDKVIAMWVADEVMTEASLGVIDMTNITIQHGKMYMLNREWPWTIQTGPMPGMTINATAADVSVRIPGRNNDVLHLYSVI